MNKNGRVRGTCILESEQSHLHQFKLSVSTEKPVPFSKQEMFWLLNWQNNFEQQGQFS